MAEFLEFPLAYHITFGTYGTRLHGGKRATVTRNQSRFGEPTVGRDVVLERLSRIQLEFPPVVLSREQREYVESAIPALCARGDWSYLLAAAQEDHVHVLLTTRVEGTRVRKWLKRWLGAALSERWPMSNGQAWWAEGGSVKQIWNEEYLETALEYVRRQRTTTIDFKDTNTE